MGTDITAAIQGFFPGGHLLRSLNQTLITLIPKTTCPTKPSQYRPVSLCNVLYKIITKILANRLRRFLSETILENQGAFVGGRQISDNILVAHKVMHALKNRRYGKKGWFAVKLDMAKAYDRLEWSFVEAVMVKFGFDRKWIQWVMECVRTVSFAIVINGEPGDFFLPQRGLRQGCPLSPYLFILCVEGFHYLIQKDVDRGDIKRIKIGKECPSISHLFFTDDSVVFGEATVKNCNALNGILDKYEKASGQLVNRDKSSLFFSPNTPTHRKEEITLALNIRHDNGGGKYLGLPSIIGRSKKGVFNYVRDNVINKMKGWKVNKLNQASREVLIKSVFLTMPNYVMQCFLLPKGFCPDLCKSISRFWWGAKRGRRKFSRLVGTNCARAKNWVEWAFGIFTLSILLSLRNRDGAWSKVNIPFFTK